MFIGLQGQSLSYKCARYARYQKEIGFKSAIVCGDTFASDACEFLKKAVGKKRSTRLILPNLLARGLKN
uniref:SRP54-type proteins GTP-binding domain-containing protein n=1 Tax=Brassica oleracea TaxID=3712 RepID=A0A3P6E0R5_BRAOL|nr:unnamed protein product [Brassica oleracea]